MSAPPNDGYGQYSGQPEQLEQPAQDGTAQDAAAAAPSKKKKRGYAAQAFEVGSGANSAVGGQIQGGGQQYGMPAPQQPAAYGNYPQPEPQPQAPGSGYQYPQAPIQPQQPAPYGGYQAPDQGYANTAPQSGGPGVTGITQGMGGMQLGGQPQQQYQQPGPAAAQQPARVGPLNQLYPTDLINNPFSVSELDLPPPPIVLPPNVSEVSPISHRTARHVFLTLICFSRASLLLLMPTARHGTFARHLMLSRRPIHCSRNPNFRSPLLSNPMARCMMMKIKFRLSRIRSSHDVAAAEPISILL